MQIGRTENANAKNAKKCKQCTKSKTQMQNKVQLTREKWGPRQNTAVQKGLIVFSGVFGAG